MPDPVRRPTIDIHIHLAGTGCFESGCWLSPRFRSRYTFRFLKLLYGLTNQQLATTADRDWALMTHTLVSESEVDYGVVLGFDGVYDHNHGERDNHKSQMIVPPEWVFKVCREYPNLLPGPSINPFRSDALELLDYCIEQGAVLIKWLPCAQGIDPTATKLKPFYERCAAAKLPLLVHMGGERTFQEVAPEFNDVDLLIAPLEAGVPVVCAHSATKIVGSSEPNQLPRLKALLNLYPHLWLDNSGLCNPGRFAHLPRLVEEPIFLERTLYGSDWPVPSNAFYFGRKLGPRAVWQLERERNQISRDVAIKRAFGYPEETLVRANAVLPNLDRWLGRSEAATNFE